jgi:hypothetical protein
MPDDSDTLDVMLQSNDGTEEIILKVSNVEHSMKNNFVKKSIIAGAGDLAGKDLSLGFENYSLQGTIADSETDTYSASLVIPDMTGYPNSAAKEAAVGRATREWGPDITNGFDELHYGPYDGDDAITGVIGKWSSTHDVGSTQPWQFSYTLEWNHLDVLIEEG